MARQPSCLASLPRAVAANRLQVAALPGTPVVVDFSFNAVTDLGLERGRMVTVALPPERVRVFAGSPE